MAEIEVESILGNTRKADVAFFESGRIDITSRVAHALNISNGDVIDVAKAGREVYLYVKIKGCNAVGKHKAQCHPTKTKTQCRNYRAFSIDLCKAILDIIGGGGTARLAAGETTLLDGIGLAVPLITRINLHNDDKRD